MYTTTILNTKAAAVALGLALATTTAAAHHSPAMFDTDQEVTLDGKVREFQMTNPHSYIQLMVPTKDGKEEEWSLEMGAAVYLKNAGLSPSTLKAGDRIRVTINPLRTGALGGLVREVTDADGKPIGKAGGQPNGKRP